MDPLPFTEDPRTGSAATARCAGSARTASPAVMTLGNAALRWTFGHLTAWGQRSASSPRRSSTWAGRTTRSASCRCAAGRASSGGRAADRVEPGHHRDDRRWRLVRDTGFYVNFNHIFLRHGRDLRADPGGLPPDDARWMMRAS
jgi:hypothetical protein